MANFVINAPLAYNEKHYETPSVRLIFNVLDDFAHAAVHEAHGKVMMQRNLLTTLHKSDLVRILFTFLDRGYRLFITSDHGTTWCRGNGYPCDRYLFETKARRALIYPNKSLAKEYTSGKAVTLYHSKSILGEKVAVFPAHRRMFGPEKETCISHGGISIEEVIVPFVEVMR